MKSHEGKILLMNKLYRLIGPTLSNMTSVKQNNYFRLIHAIRDHILGEHNEKQSDKTAPQDEDAS